MARALPGLTRGGGPDAGGGRRLSASPSTRCATSFPQEDLPAGPHPARAGSPRWCEEGLQRRYPRRRRPRRCAGRSPTSWRSSTGCGYAGYFLAVCTTSSASRASAASSARAGAAPPTRPSATRCGITSIDPVRMGLLFERFLSLERPRAPGHRRRLRARAARGGAAVRLREARAGAGGDGLRGHLLPRPARRARGGQGAGARRSTRWTGWPASPR